MARLDSFFRLMNAQGASDLHLASGNLPALRIKGDIERVHYHVLENDELRDLLYEMVNQELRTGFGMIYGDDALEDLVKGQMVAPEDAFESAEEKERFLPFLKKVPEEYRELLEAKSEGARGTRPAPAAR